MEKKIMETLASKRKRVSVLYNKFLISNKKCKKEICAELPFGWQMEENFETRKKTSFKNKNCDNVKHFKNKRVSLEIFFGSVGCPMEVSFFWYKNLSLNHKKMKLSYFIF